MTGHWFFDLLIILILAVLVLAFWPGIVERIQRSRARLQAKSRQLSIEIERKKKG